MNLVQLLESDKEKLLRQMKSADPEKVQKAMVKELDRMLYRYLEETEEEAGRQMAQGLFETAKSSAAFLLCQGETEVWERRFEEGKEGKSARPYRIYPLVLLGLGLILMVASYIMPVFQNGIHVSALTVLLIFGGALLVFVSGLRLLKPKDAMKSELRAETKLDPEEVYASLRAMVTVMDQALSEAVSLGRGSREKQQESEAMELDRATVELYAGLLEAAVSGDGDYALSEAAKVKYYLHQKGVEAVDYTAEQKQLFDVIAAGPADSYDLAGGRSGEITTLRPALVVGSKVVKKGLAGKH